MGGCVLPGTRGGVATLAAPLLRGAPGTGAPRNPRRRVAWRIASLPGA